MHIMSYNVKMHRKVHGQFYTGKYIAMASFPKITPLDDIPYLFKKRMTNPVTRTPSAQAQHRDIGSHGKVPGI